MRGSLRRAGHEQIENGHADRDAVGDLLEYRGAGTVGDVRSNFRSTVDGAGMEDERVGLGEFHALGVQLIQEQVIRVRKRGFLQAFGLYAENDDYVGILERFFDAIHAPDGRARWANVFEFAGNPHRGAAEGEAAAEFAEEMKVRTGHAGMRDVAKDGDIEILERAFPVSNGECIEQALGGVLVRAVA